MIPGFLLSTSWSWRTVRLALLAGCLIAGNSSHATAQYQASETDTVGGKISRLLGLGGSSSEKKPGPLKATRIVFEIEREAQFDVFSLVKANQVILELPQMRMGLPSVGKHLSGSLVKGVRVGVASPGQTRIIIQLAAPGVVENAAVIPRRDGLNPKLVLNIAPSKKSKTARGRPDFSKKISSLGARGLQPPMPRKAVTRGQRNARSYRPVIVIDPGHGGHDSGAKKNGVLEKNAVLAVSKLVRDKLAKTGRFDVRMTRDRDVFVSLGGRREFAERNKAVLFVSIHADYAKRAKASGATIYSLRERVARRLKKGAKRQVASNLLTKKEMSAIKASSSGIGAVQNILADLARRDVEATAYQTASFTQTVIKHMGQSTDMRSRPHRSAAFKVLKTVTMPAVLIELAYVTNRRDAKRLKSASWRRKVSGSIAEAIENYFRDGSRLPM